MKPLIIAIASCFLIFPFSIAAQRESSISPEAEAFYNNAMSQINERHVTWIKSTAKNVNVKNLSTDDVKKEVINYAVLGNLAGQDIEALCFLVMMQASKDAQEDLKTIMDNVKAINDKKKAVQDAITKLNENNQVIYRVLVDSFKLLLQNRSVLQKTNTTNAQQVTIVARDSTRTMRTATSQPVSKREIDDLKNKLQITRDSLNDLNQEQQLKMQMIMDRMTKAYSVASNMLKKISDTAQSIIQNLK